MDLMAMRRSLLSASKYRFLEYVRGARLNSFIDTGISGGNSNLTITGKFVAEAFSNYGAMFGNYLSESHNVTRLIFSTQRAILLFGLNTKANPSSSNNGLSSIVGEIINFTLADDGLTLNGIKKGLTKNNGTANTTNIALNANRVDASSTNNNYYMKWYRFTIYDQEVKVRDFVPAKRLSDGKIGFLDKVNNVFYPSIGVADFTEPT